MTTLHEIDFVAWLDYQKDCIRKRDFENLDIENLLEEMEEMGGSLKSAIESHLGIILLHMLKQKYQPDMSCNSWNASISGGRNSIAKIIRRNPSLKNFPQNVLKESYEDARKWASKESGISKITFPISCPWTLREVLGE